MKTFHNRQKIPFLMLLAVVSLTLACKNRSLTSSESEMLVGIVRELEKGVATGNNESWKKYMADDAVLINRDGKSYSKAEIVDEIVPLPAGKVLDIQPINVRVFSNSSGSAMVTFVADEKLSIWGQKVDTQYPSVMYFEKRSGEWQMLMFTYFERPVDPGPVAVSKAYLKSFEGTYRVSDSMRIDVTSKDSLLTYKKAGSDKPGTSLFPINHQGSFFRKGTESEYLFTKDEAGRDIILQRRNWIDLIWTKEQ